MARSKKLTSPVHIGCAIKERLVELDRTNTWLAGKINCDRTNVYKITHRDSIDTEALRRICLALDYDFFAVYSENIREAKQSGAAQA